MPLPTEHETTVLGSQQVLVSGPDLRGTYSIVQCVVWMLSQGGVIKSSVRVHIPLPVVVLVRGRV